MKKITNLWKKPQKNY